MGLFEGGLFASAQERAYQFWEQGETDQAKSDLYGSVADDNSQKAYEAQKQGDEPSNATVAATFAFQSLSGLFATSSNLFNLAGNAAAAVADRAEPLAKLQEPVRQLAFLQSHVKLSLFRRRGQLVDGQDELIVQDEVGSDTSLVATDHYVRIDQDARRAGRFLRHASTALLRQENQALQAALKSPFATTRYLVPLAIEAAEIQGKMTAIKDSGITPQAENRLQGSFRWSSKIKGFLRF